MSPGIIIAIGIGIATAPVMALVAARSAGGGMGPDESYGHELDAPRTMRGRRGMAPGRRQRAVLAIVVAALAALGAGLATGLSQGTH